MAGLAKAKSNGLAARERSAKPCTGALLSSAVRRRLQATARAKTVLRLRQAASGALLLAWGLFQPRGYLCICTISQLRLMGSAPDAASEPLWSKRWFSLRRYRNAPYSARAPDTAQKKTAKVSCCGCAPRKDCMPLFQLAALRACATHPLFVGLGHGAVPERVHALFAHFAVVYGGGAAVAPTIMHAPIHTFLVLQAHCHGS